MKLTFLLGSVFAFGSSAGLAWGPEGHKVVANIAQFYLTNDVQQQVAQLMNSDPQAFRLAAVANWADQVRPLRPETAPWHFIDIPLDRNSIDPAQDCAGDNCVVAKVKFFADVLQNRASGDKVEALQFLVHFMGDMHQPLHCSNNNDRGGNQVHVNFLGQHDNLHRVWDSSLLNQMTDEDQLTSDLISAITPAQKQAWTQGAPEDWALEAHRQAVTVAYPNVPKRKGRRLPQLDEDYETVADPVVTVQLQKAGVRLASVLNSALAPAAPPTGP